MSRVRDIADNSAVFADGISTADITEGSNLFFTNSRADARITLKMIDEDNMSSDSAAHMPSQQSVKAYVDTEVAGLVASAPGTLDTLNELAAALGDDANFSTTVTNSIATKLPLAGGTLTGNLAHTGNFTIDVVGDLTLDAGGGDILLKDDGAHWASIYTNGTNTYIQNMVNSGDLYLSGKDSSGNGVNALVADMSNLGFATFNANAFFNETSNDTDFRIKSVNETNMFYVDASTDRIGIGTDSPTGLLDLEGSGATQYINSTSGNSNLLFQLNGTTTGSIEVGGGNSVYITANNASGHLYFRTGSADTRMFVSSGGYVGIGTTSPDKTLTVRGTSGDVVQAKIIYAGTDGDRSGLILQNTHTGGREYGLYVGNNSTGAGLGNSFGIRDNTASAYRMIINSSGNVGIATDSPGYPLQVNGNLDILNVKGNAGNAFVRFTDGDATADFSIGSDDGSAAGSGAFILYDRSNSAYRFMVNSSGNVAIGATNPTQTLEVSAGAPTIGLNSPGQVTNKKIVRIAASQYNAGDFSIQQMNDDGTTLGANTLTIRADGNIGIGNTTDAKNPPSQIFIARNHSSYNDGNNNKRIDFMANGYTTRNETIRTFHYSYHPVFNQYSWHIIKLGDASSATGHTIRYKVIWTTGHASGHGYEEGVCSVLSHHGTQNLNRSAGQGQGQPHVRIAYQWQDGSYYGWTSSPSVRFYHSTATGTNAQVYMRVRGYGQHNGSTWDMACCHTIHVELYGSNYVTDRTVRFTGHSTPSDAGSILGVLDLG